jgi:hypothetical protein
LSRLHNYRFPLTLGLAITLGLALRLMLITQSGWRIDYDEAMIGLMALRVLRGEWMAFVPAQPTLGAIEAYLLAPVLGTIYRVPTVVAFRLVSLALAGLYILSTSLVANKAFGDRAGALAALLAAVAPPYMLIGSLKTWGATIETIILGNCLLLVTATIIPNTDFTDEPNTKNLRNLCNLWSRYGLMGLIAGVMFWNAWLGVYSFVPVVVLLLWKGRPALARSGWTAVVMAILAFLAGSLPFWAYNLNHSFATFSTALRGSPLTADERSAVLSHAWLDLLPRLVSGDPTWQVSGPRGLAILSGLYYGSLLGLLIWPMTRRAFLKQGASLRWMLAIFVLAVPILYLASGYSRNALNPWEVDATGRYVLMLHTALPVGIAALATALSRWRVMLTRLLAVSIILMTITLNGLGILRLDPVVAFDSPYYNRLPASLDPLIDALDAHGITHVWVDAGIGQVLMFQTRERITAADYYDSRIAGGLVRFPDVLVAIQEAPKAAFVVPVMAGQANPPIQRALDATGVDYDAVQVTSTMMLYIPKQWIDPAILAPGLGYQY